MAKTVFQKIIRGDIPCVKLYEDEICLVILDINPVSKGHALVICKKLIPTLGEADEETLNRMLQVARKIDLKQREILGCDAVNIVINDGHAAGQAVPQLHIHLIPRYENDGKFSPPPHEKYEEGEMEALGRKLKL